MPNSPPQNHDVEANDKRSDQDGDPAAPRSRISLIIEDFSFIWFTLSMNTGILSILMHQLPYQFYGLGIISTILFVFNIVLFIVFFILLLLRCIMYPQSLVQTCSTNISELSLMGAVPIAWFTIVAQVGLTVSNASWGGQAFFIVALVMWWIGTAVMLTISCVVIVVFSKTDIVNATTTLNPAIIVPFVGTTTDALVGGVICQYSGGVNARLAIPIIVTSYMICGLGFFVAIIIWAAYFVKLMNSGLPPPPLTPSLFMLVGPAGQTAAALQVLGAAAKTYFGAYDKGTFLQAQPGEMLATLGVVLGLFILGIGLLFAFFAVYIILETTFKRQQKYTLIWWSTIFPMATVNTSFIEFGNEMDSPTFRTLATILFLLLLIDYILNWIFTIRDIWLGKLLNGPRSERPPIGRMKGQ
ncbi:hypothetical protein KC332_g4826 [Hortaea werneckii]|uniref:Sulfite efflux pump SSU1 n=2 Tax=Hortaea werneckii TaxID=91943 RepID=A0A3M7IMC8_HORWE|nr:hypothetical protein KC358_g4786 [Hortaea werneckii]OTA22702.1 hypothetical protein BTJ68_13810 [Hortaea werneckii EXF-2000]KAI6839464.1 hypothetical protein KC350_g5635 [Hortaea werneckii]KAI6937149.1 hypothetical protein KC341_g5748 [Hortaea werneckii]KAI6940438.1 hypothetical protein KC348_g5010 [Hortaea werneckii]